jgi:hypothetical protein
MGRAGARFCGESSAADDDDAIRLGIHDEEGACARPDSRFTALLVPPSHLKRLVMPKGDLKSLVSEQSGQL